MITCDCEICEIYEICPSCAPSQAAFDRAVEQRKIALRDAEILPPSSPSYTLAEIEQLAKEWTKTQELTSNDRWLISHLFAWIKRREKEESGR